MNHAGPLPHVRHMLSLNNENHWSNVLAALMETDQATTRQLLDLAGDGELVIRREVTSGPNRPDLVVSSASGAVLAVVEVKILSGLGQRQLERYLETIEMEGWTASAKVLISLQRLPLHLPPGSPWHSLTWEQVLDAFTGSADVWVSAFARAALAHLAESLPEVSQDTRWCDVGAGEDFPIALRARQAWVFGALDDPPHGDRVLHPASGGRSWVTTVRMATTRPGYEVLAEVEEQLPVRSWPSRGGGSIVPRGPSVRVCLLQNGVTTSAGFDWGWLFHLWISYMATFDKPWSTRSAVPKAAHDKSGHASMVAQGAPTSLGIGYGDAQAKQTRECLFGARYDLGDRILQDVADDLNSTIVLVSAMARCEHWRDRAST